MTTTPKVLIQPKLAEVTETVQYPTTPADAVKTAIDKFTATNTGGANATLTVHLVPSGGAAGAANAFTKTIAPGASWPFPELVGHVLEAGDAISTIASVATVSIRASGRQFT
jgi:hypothetical protein